MKRSLIPVCLFVCFVIARPAPAQKKTAGAIKWQKTVIDKTFRSEGVAVADVNKDGKLDILNGEAWYEAPDWKMHAIRKLGNYGDGLRGYSNSFACWADDFNKDGYSDLLVIGFPGAPCHWFENPKGKTDVMWKQHVVWHSACNETPQYQDLFGTGERALVMGWQPKGKGNQGQMSWFKPGSDPTKIWEEHAISKASAPKAEIPGTRRFSHGLGVADVNGDKKADVICTNGYWIQPDEGKLDKPWEFVKANLGQACSDIYTVDMDGDGNNDVITSSAHRYGIWWHQQKKGKETTFLQRDLFPKLVSETHAMHYADINGDGMKDLITGKRFWSHGKREPGAQLPAMIYWLKAEKSKDKLVKFTPLVIDNDSGIGTQFVVMDVNGDKLLDVVTSNKKGTYLLIQKR